MECRITSTNKTRRAMTVVETLIAIGVGSLIVTVLASLTVYSSKSLVSMFAYTDLNQDCRETLDFMTKEIRQSRGLTTRTPTSLEFQMDGETNTYVLKYAWDSVAKTFSEIKNGVTNVLLNDCTFWTNSIYQRTPEFNSWELVRATTPSQAKLIQLTWVCERDNVNQIQSESVQSMKIVIRKKVN
jgi:Tfp pilus assembly protein PilW